MRTTVGLLLAVLAAPAAAQPADMAARSAAIAEGYLQAWSRGDDAPVADVPYIYGPRVRFYGKDMSQAELVAEKRRALRRWPVRRYAHRPGSIRVTCNDRTRRCAVRSVYDYDLADPATGASSRGSATFDLGVSFEGPRPVILYEGGGRKVGRRG